MNDVIQQHLVLRDAAMESVEQNANVAFENFSTIAAEHVLSVLRQRGPLSSEELTNACKESGIVPHDDRAFGPVYMKLSRAGQIQKVAYCARKKGHGTSGGIVWSIT